LPKTLSIKKFSWPKLRICPARGLQINDGNNEEYPVARSTLFKEDTKFVRDTLQGARECADRIHQQEKELVGQLRFIDFKRYYVRFGYNSLSGYVRYGLRFSRTQTQRIVTAVRRPEPTANFGHEGGQSSPSGDGYIAVASYSGSRTVNGNTDEKEILPPGRSKGQRWWRV
jgi:hypothetical protein